MLQKAENEILRMCQAKHFWQEIEAVNSKNRVPSTRRFHQCEWVEDLRNQI